MGRRTALVGLAATAAALAVAIGAQAAGETIVVKGDGSPATTKSILQNGTQLTISETLATSNTTEVDAFYQVPIGMEAPQKQEWLYVKSAFPGSTTQGSLSAFLTSYPAYQPSHVYHVTVSTSLGPTTFLCQGCVSLPHPGQFTVAISGPGAVGPELPPISSPSATPKLGVTTDYKVIGLGAVGVVNSPPPTNGTDLSTDIGFVDDNGNPVAGPSIDAINEQAGKAGAVCFLLALAGNRDEAAADQEAFGLPKGAFARCADVVARVLARADQIRRQKGAASAAARCPQLVRKKRATPTLRVTCTLTSTGAHIDIRPIAKARTIKQALRGQKLQLIVARSSIPTPGPAPARLRVRWAAH